MLSGRKIQSRMDAPTEVQSKSRPTTTTDAFSGLDFVDGDIVDLRQQHRSPVTFTDFPDMLPPSRETSGSNIDNHTIPKSETNESTASTNREGAVLNHSPTPSPSSNSVEHDTGKNDKNPATIPTSKSAATITTAASTSTTNMAVMMNQQPSPQGAQYGDVNVPSMSIMSSSLREQVRLGSSKRTDFPLIPSKAALLIIDVQTYACVVHDGETSDNYYSQVALPKMISNIQQLLTKFRTIRDRGSIDWTGDEVNCESPGGGTNNTATNTDPMADASTNTSCEVIFTMIQASTIDGRDISLDYKLSGPFFKDLPKVNVDKHENSNIFLPNLRPNQTLGKGDIVIPKTSSSVFASTNLDYMLKNLHVEQLVVCGQYTDQCVESAVRTAADLGYFVTVVDDACATASLEQHQRGLAGMKGYCRIVSTEQVLHELSLATSSSTSAQPAGDHDDMNHSTALVKYYESVPSPPYSTSIPQNFAISDMGLTRDAEVLDVPGGLRQPTTPTAGSGSQTSKTHSSSTALSLALLKSLKFAGIKFLRYVSLIGTNGGGGLSDDEHDDTLERRQQQTLMVPVDVLQSTMTLDQPFPIHSVSPSSTQQQESPQQSVIFRPDPTTLQFLPYAPKTAMMFGTLYEPLETNSKKSMVPSPYCARHLLQSISVTRAREHGIAFNHVQAKLSFTLLHATTKLPIDNYKSPSVVSQRTIDQSEQISTLYDQLKEQEISVIAIDAGMGPGQIVVTLGGGQPVKLADELIASKETILAVAQAHNCMAIFQKNNKLTLSLSFVGMSQPSSTLLEPNRVMELSTTGKQFVEGILSHGHGLLYINAGGASMRPISATKTTYDIGSSVPRTNIGWSTTSAENRPASSASTTMIQISTNNLQQTMHVEYTSRSSACNIYLVLGAILACGLHGVREEMTLRPEWNATSRILDGGDNVSNINHDNENKSHLTPLSELFENDVFLLQTLGPELSESYRQ